MISDLQPLIDASHPVTQFSLAEWNTSTLATEFYDAYHPVEDLYAFGDQLVRDFPGLVEGFTVGYAAEGREIRGWKASKPVNATREAERNLKSGKKRKGHKHRGEKVLEFVVQGGSHAREVSRFNVSWRATNSDTVGGTVIHSILPARTFARSKRRSGR